MLAGVFHYTVSLHGIPLLAADFCLRTDAKTYEAAVLGRTVGLVDVLMHGRSEIHVQGAIDAAGHVRPNAYTERSRLSGDNYAVTIDCPDGQPLLRAQTPPQDKYRLPIPPAALPGAIDGVSAVVVQSLAAARGMCPGDTRIYDGRQVRLLSLHDGVADRLAGGVSAYQGAALRCATDSTMLAGFLKGQSIKSQSKPARGTLWLAPAPAGGPAVPVRMVFDAAFFGDVVVRLDAASIEPVDRCGGTGWAHNPR